MSSCSISAACHTTILTFSLPLKSLRRVFLSIDPNVDRVVVVVVVVGRRTLYGILLIAVEVISPAVQLHFSHVGY